MKKIIALIMAGIMCMGLTSCKKVSDKKDMAYVEEKGKLTIGVTIYPPMNYLDDDGNWTGFDTEFAQAVGKKLGFDVEFKKIDWGAKETELASKNIDCLWNGMCITEERKEMWEVTKPYMYNTQAMVMKKDREAEIMADISGKKVIAENGSTGEGKITGEIDDSIDSTVEVMAKDYFANANYTPVSSMANALMEVDSGMSDVALVDSVIAQGTIGGENAQYKDLVINTDNKFGDQYFGIAFRKGDVELCEKVNKAIDELIESGELNKIAEKYGLTEGIEKAAAVR